MTVQGQKVAVVGSGVSGLASAWLLQFHGAEVTLYESEATCGGHTLTDHSSGYPVDLGFQVYNLTTYPHFMGWMEHLGVESETSNMSFSISVDKGELEWASHGLNSIFGQRKNCVNPSFLRMIWDVLRFGREAPEVLSEEKSKEFANVTLGQYLEANKYSQGFKDNYVAPMCAAVWSVPYKQALAFPVQMLIRFWVNHHLLDILQRPLWRVLRDRGEAYVKEVLKYISHVHTSTPVHSVKIKPGAEGSKSTVEVHHAGGVDLFDKVVLATHSDTARKLRGQDITTAEADVLDAIPYSYSKVYLHTDPELMPTRKVCYASWNVIATSGEEQQDADICVSYGVKSLQTLPEEAPDLFVTLNCPQPPRDGTIINEMTLSHPIFSMASWKAQSELPKVQGTGGGCVYYTGAWCGYGFHEDGMRSAVAALHAMGLQVPWTARSTQPKLSIIDSYVVERVDRYLTSAITTGALRILRPDGSDSQYGPSDVTVLQPAIVPAFPTPAAFEIGSIATAGAAQSSGSCFGALDPNHPMIRTHQSNSEISMRAFVRVLEAGAFTRVALRGSVGLLRAYKDREIEVSDIGAFAQVLMHNTKGLAAHESVLGVLQWMGGAMLYSELVHEHSNVDSGYIAAELQVDQLGKDVYANFLDEEMHVTPAQFAAGQASLAEAHSAFTASVFKAALVSKADHVLEIGGGWGAVAMSALKDQNCIWTATFQSSHQMENFGKLAKSKGMQQRAHARLCGWLDLRTVLSSTQQYSSILAIDPATMATVQAKQITEFYQVLSDCTAPGGTVTVLALYAAKDLAAADSHRGSFFKNEFCPGGELPTKAHVLGAARTAGLQLMVSEHTAPDATDMSKHFAATLRVWRLKLVHVWHACWKSGARDSQLRQLEISLALMEAALETGMVGCELLTWSTVNEGPEKTRDQAAAAVNVAQRRMERQASISKLVSTEMAGWVQGLALLVVGMLLTIFFGLHRKG